MPTRVEEQNSGPSNYSRDSNELLAINARYFKYFHIPLG